MAQDTLNSTRNLVIYEIYVRNHGPNGTFTDVQQDLERIRALGVDIIWFMPIHPIGKINKKGSLGCPYSISDYREVNPEYGTKDDFARLINKAHELGLKVMIDVVYNHTAHDSVLVGEHPDWYHQDSTGKPVTTVPDWSDVIDLKHPNPDLSNYLIDSLVLWAQFGVDGFRCDVASLIPEAFWVKARAQVEKVKPGVIWLAESVHAGFVEERRRENLYAISDSEVYRGFDITYDYDIVTIWQAVIKEKLPVSRYIEMLRFQDAIYPENFNKLRFVENHDQPRILGLVQDKNKALAWTAFTAFNRGAFLIYGGQESAENRTPSLFDIDKVNWKNYEMSAFLTAITKIKKDPAQQLGKFVIIAADPVIQAVWRHDDGNLYGVFNVNSTRGKVNVNFPDGEYVDLISKKTFTVKSGLMELPESACIFRVKTNLSDIKPVYCDLLDFSLHQ